MAPQLPLAPSPGSSIFPKVTLEVAPFSSQQRGGCRQGSNPSEPAWGAAGRLCPHTHTARAAGKDQQFPITIPRSGPLPGLSAEAFARLKKQSHSLLFPFIPLTRFVWVIPSLELISIPSPRATGKSVNSEMLWFY